MVRFASIVGIYLLAASPIFAATSWDGCLSQGVPTIKCFEIVFGNLARAVIGLAALGFFVMLLVAGFKLLISGGDQKKLQEAKGAMTNAIIGMVVIAVSYLILLTVKQITGVNVTQFNLNF